MKKRTIQPLLSILMALSLVLSIFAAPISAIGNSDMTPQAEVQANLLSAFEMSYNNKDGDWTTINNGGDIEVDLSDVNSVLLKYELTRPQNVELLDGDTYVIELPPFFDGSATAQPVVVNEKEVGTYSIADGKITFTFNANAATFDNLKMNVNISGEFSTEVFETVEEIKVVVPFQDESSFEATVRGKADDYKGEDKKEAGFQYVLDGDEKKKVDRNPEYIDWTVLANGDMASITSAKIVDNLGDNLELVPGSIKAYRIIRNYMNVEIDREEVTITPEMLAASTSGFTLNLGSIEDAYEISYTTTLIRPDGGGTHQINNKATIILDSVENEVKDSITATWSTDLPLIEKKGQATEDPHVLDWEVEYNYAQADLGTVSLSDNLTHGEVILDSVEVFKVDVDIDGNIVSGTKVAVDVTPTLVDGKLTIPDLDANGQAYYISYSSTVPVGLNDVTVTNTISDDLKEPNTATDSVLVNTIPTGGKVGEQHVDADGNPYIEWTITLNSNKVNVGHITIRDVFKPEYLDFDVSDISLYKLYKDDVEATNFRIEEYIHEVDGEPDGREGFKLDITNAGPHTYKFVYRTYYTQAGMAQPELANHAELVFLTGEGGTGIGEPQPLPDAKIEGPKAGIHKDGSYIVNADGNQEIEWTVVFNQSEVLLNANSTLTEEFVSENYTYLAGSLTLTDAAKNVLEEGEDYSLAIDNDSKGFVLTLIKATNATLTLRFRTTVDDTTNLKHENKATLTWQGGTETGEKTVPKRDAGISKSGEVDINDDGSKTVKWTVSFNTQKNVIHNFVLTDTYTPTTVSVSDIKIMSGGADVTADFTINNPGTGGSFTVSKTKLDAKEYTLTYKTTLSPVEEQQAIKNTAAITYIGGSDSIEEPLSSPSLQVEKQADNIANSSNWENPRINWTIFANTDSANKFISLVDAVVADTIPADQRLVSGSVSAYRSDNEAISVDATDIAESDNGFTISLPNGPYQWTITYQSEILYLPSEDATVFDKYNNTVVLTNQSNDEVLKQEDDASAWIRYYANKANDLTGKSGQQNPDTENIDYTVTINPEGLTIHNAKITDSLYTTDRNKHHEYVDGSIKLFDANDKEITEGFALAVAPDKLSFEITFDGTGTIDSKYTIKYSTRLKSNLVGNYTVVNNIVLTGGTEDTELAKSSTTTTAQQWFYGGGGEGRNVELQINKINNQGNNPGPIENAVFKLERINLDGSTTLVDADIVTNENGVFIKGDIRAGRYKLTETATPALYQLMTSPVFFLIGYTDPADYEYKGDELLNPYTVTITKSNWAKATHSHASAEANELTLVNDYNPVSVFFTAGKNLTGQELARNQFSFGLFNEDEQTVTTSQNSVDGVVSFPAQTFNNTGTYTYTVREIAGSQGGMTYDPAEFNVSVEVSVGAEGLVAAVTYTDSESTVVEQPEFYNTYEASGEWTPEVNKALDAGGRVLAADEFNFKLTPVDGAPMPQGENAALTELFASNAADGKVVFASIPYTQADSGQTYYYDVVEVEGTETGMTYDEMTVRIRVDISDKRDGTLSIVPTVQAEQGEEADSEFNNTYVASGEWTPEVSKHLDAGGRELANSEFNFKLTPADDATMPSGLAELEASNDLDGKVEFTTIPYTEADIGQTYYYDVVEVAGSEKGMTYDPMTVRFKVEITDAGDGVLNVETTVETEQGAEADTEFNNAYVASGSYVVAVEKELSGRELFAEEFNFKLTPVAGATMPEDGDSGESLSELLTTNTAEGKVQFAELTYTQEDIGNTYYYTITEVAGTEGSISYDPLVITLKVVITDNGNGDLAIDASYLIPEDAEEADTTFNNQYSADGSWVPTVSKVLTAGGRQLQADEFSFDLYLLAEDGETWLLQQTALNAADGGVTFEPVSYTEVDTGQEYTYKIVERNSSEIGMTYDQLEVEIVVTVEDNELVGELEITTEYSEERVFNNSYEATGTFVPEVKKDLLGRDLAAAEFEFTLMPVDSAPMPLAGDNEAVSSLTATNAADGKVIFDAISFSETDIGRTYNYLITEVKGELGGVEYSTQEIVLTVSIADAGNGELAISSSYTDAATFTNKYTVAPIEVVLEAEKELKGMDLVDDQFEFELLDEDGQVLETVTNAADGSIVFSAIEYSAAGEYNYSMREVKGKAAGFIYDETEYRVTVVVKDNGDGTFSTDIRLTDGAVLFSNAYSDSLAATGENISTVQTLGAVLLGLGVLTLIQRRRRHSREA